MKGFAGAGIQSFLHVPRDWALDGRGVSECRGSRPIRTYDASAKGFPRWARISRAESVIPRICPSTLRERRRDHAGTGCSESFARFVGSAFEIPQTYDDLQTGVACLKPAAERASVRYGKRKKRRYAHNAVPTLRNRSQHVFHSFGLHWMGWYPMLKQLGQHDRDQFVWAAS